MVEVSSREFMAGRVELVPRDVGEQANARVSQLAGMYGTGAILSDGSPSDYAAVV